MIQAEFYNIALALLMATASGLVSAFALMRKMTLASDVMSHIALPGLGLALLYGFNPILGGATTLLLGVLLLWKIESVSGINTDAVIGVVFAVSLAVGTLITPQEDIIEALFGGMSAISLWEFIIGVVASCLVIVFILKKRHALTLALVSKDLAKTTGINTRRLNLYFLLIFAITIILGLRYLGVLLMGSLIIIPPAIARNLAENLNGMLLLSVLTAILSMAIGLFIASVYNLALGPVVIGIAGVIFLLTLFLKKS